jgi:adenylyltransferase/sulfurtransferase
MAGFDTIRIIDPDCIKETNLNRQLLYREADIGKPKAGTTPARGLIRSIDMIIDGLDNYPARLADAAWKCRISFIHGAVEGFYGLVCTSVPKTSTCLRCTVPNPPRVLQTPVVGVTTGVIGCVQVTEAIKRATGTGYPHQ